MQLSLYSFEGPPRPGADVIVQRRAMLAHAHRAYASAWRWRNKAMQVKAICPDDPLAQQVEAAGSELRTSAMRLLKARRNLAAVLRVSLGMPQQLKWDDAPADLGTVRPIRL